MKQILLTCDTEIGELANKLEGMFDIFVNGNINGEHVGVSLINSIAKQYGAIVNHFVDVYPTKYEHEIRILCNSILADGHTIGLHTHPSSKWGNRYMEQYSIDKQNEIIGYGLENIYKWTNLQISEHRAGGYNLTCDLINILNKNGIKKDFSYYFNNDICRYQDKYINSVKKIGNIWEIPITVYCEKKNLYGFTLKKNYKKLDFRYGSDVDTILEVIDKAPNNAVITLFLHSFNFLRRTYDFKKNKFINISINYKLIDEYHRLLNELKLKDKCTFKSIYNMEVCSDNLDFCSEINKNVSIKKILKNKIDINKIKDV